MSTTNADETIVKEIVINATAERVFDALTDPARRVKWWGVPGKFQTTHMDSDLRPGGRWEMRGDGPGGAPFALRGEYRAIERPRILEFTWLHESPGQPALQTVVRFDLAEAGGLTTVRLTHSGLATPQSRDYYQGWPWILSLLKGYAERQESR